MSRTDDNQLTLRATDAQDLHRLLGLNITQSERMRIEFLLGMAEALPLGETETGLRAKYESEGVVSTMDASGGRGPDFKKNLDQGYWAEQLLRSYRGPVQFIYFGLSDPVQPHDPKYESTRRKHRFILLTEGKRPDVLIVEPKTVHAHPEILEWANRPLEVADYALLRAEILAGAEIKSSLQDYAARQKFRELTGATDISITVKSEEFADLDRWQSGHGLPIVVLQVFADRMFVVSYQKFKASPADVRNEEKTGKETHFVSIEKYARPFARIDVLQADYRFATNQRGAVSRPASWPPAQIANVSLPDFRALKGNGDRILSASARQPVMKRC
jgi:hypothetical protein